LCASQPSEANSGTLAQVRALARSAVPVPFTLETLPKVGNRLVEAEAATGMTVVDSEDGPEPPGRSEDETA